MKKLTVGILILCLATILMAGTHTFTMHMEGMDASCASGLHCATDAGMSFDCLTHCLQAASPALPSAPAPILVLLGILSVIFFATSITVTAQRKETRSSDWIGKFLRYRSLLGVRLLN